MEKFTQSQIGGGRNYLLITKGSGKFYYATELDAFILKMLMGYKIISKNRCGFPDNAFNRVINKLNECKISYKVEITNGKPIVKDYKLLNNYSKYSKKAFINQEAHNKLDYIVEKLKSCNENQIEKVIEAIKECLE